MRISISEFTNSTTQTVAQNGTILFSSNTYPKDVYTYNSNGTISIKVPGIYEVNAVINVLGTGEGDIGVQMIKDSNAAQNTLSTASLAASGDYGNIAITDIINVSPAATASGYAMISFQANAATSIANATCIIKRVG